MADAAVSDAEEDGLGDLSPYELARLRNIRRNREVLASLGLPTSAAGPPRTAPPPKQQPPPAKRARKDRDRPARAAKGASRRSSRLAGKKPEFEGGFGDDGDAELGAAHPAEPATYEDMPVEPRDLDPHEFELFVVLRKWRLKRKIELDIEPYKVCQNRTLCELVRRRRNDPEWATSKDPSDELLSCWGLGPSKVRLEPEPGFGHEMLAELNRPECAVMLAKSRRFGNGAVMTDM